jgi:thymidylate synthase
MILEGKYLDEILRKLYSELSKSNDLFSATKGSGKDLLAPKIILKTPRARISATESRGRLISALAEFCWYMSGSADLEFIRFYIRHYPPPDKTGSLKEAYGPRLIGTGKFGFSINQVDRVLEKLSSNPDTRRAIISLLNTDDLQPNNSEAPCTTALQFIRRRERLHLVTMMRSNDAYLGFPHDVFCFTMVQEYIARCLGIKIGEYHHFATSLHLYDEDSDKVKNYLSEGFQNPTFAMPSMPSGCQRNNLHAFLQIEVKIRTGKITDASQISLPTYWRDLSLVLLRHADSVFRRGTQVREKNFSHVSEDFYKNFFVKRPKFKTKNFIKTESQDLLPLKDIDAK